MLTDRRLLEILTSLDEKTVRLPEGFKQFANLVEAEATKLIVAERDALSAKVKSSEEGIMCHDCLDTGWLENREEDRYVCSCVAETEPYQILQIERDALATQNNAMREALEYFGVLKLRDGTYADKCCVATAALSLPDLSTAVLRRRDAKVIERCAKVADREACALGETDTIPKAIRALKEIT